MKTYIENDMEVIEFTDSEGTECYGRSHASISDNEAYFAQVERRHRLDKIGAVVVVIVALVIIVNMVGA